MSQARKRRQAIRWARYFNHYSHNPDVLVGGSGASRVIWRGLLGHRTSRPFVHVRRQVKQRRSS
jgi:hypothetical protein